MKYLTRLARSVLVLIVVVASSCSDAGFLLPVGESEPGIVIMSVYEGSVLMPEDTFEVALDYDDEELFPDRMVIELLDVEGSVLFSVDLDQDDIYQLPLPVLLPDDLAEGLYTVSVTVFEEGEEAAFDSAVFFFVREEYEIDTIAAYPEIFYPGGAGLVLADLNIPDGADPFLRWSSGDMVFLEGTLSDGADALQFEVPDREGVITILLEVFPFGPKAVGADADQQADLDQQAGSGLILETFDFVSFISLEAQFFVSSSQDVNEEDFGPDEDYYSLFHFRGETVDWGFHGDGASAVPVGTPELAIEDGVFGFLLDGSSGFAVDDILVPFENGVLQPFSFSGRFASLRQSGTIFAAEENDGNPVFSVGYDDSGFLTAAVGGSTPRPVSSGTTDGVTELTLTVIPGEETIRFLWFLDGALVADELTAYMAAIEPTAGSTLIGGPGGMHGVIDEIGIYYQTPEEGTDVDTGVFARAMERLFGTDLVLAEGFDGIVLDDYIIYIADDAAADYSIDSGALYLPPGTGVGLALILEDFESLSISIETADNEAEAAGVLILENIDGDEVVVDLADSLTMITLTYKNGVLSAYYGEDATVVQPIGETLVIRNRSDDSSLELRSVLIVKDQLQSDE